MDKDKLLWEALSNDGLYSGTYEDFKKQFANTESRRSLYSSMKEDNLYSKSFEDFHAQFFEKKSPDGSESTSPREQSVSESTSLGSSASSEAPRPKADEVPEKPRWQDTETPNGELPVLGTDEEPKYQKFVQKDRKNHPVFEKIKEVFTSDEGTFLERFNDAYIGINALGHSAARSVASGLAGLGSNIANAPTSFSELMIPLVADEEELKEWNSLSPDDKNDMIRMLSAGTATGGVTGAAEELGQVLDKTKDQIDAKRIKFEGNITEDLASGNFLQAGYRVVDTMLESGPTMAAAAMPGGIPLLIGTSISGEAKQSRKEGRDLSTREAVNSIIKGTAEGAFEITTRGLLNKALAPLKGNKKAAAEVAESIMDRILERSGRTVAKDLAKAGRKEGLSEVYTVLTQDISDAITRGEFDFMQTVRNIADAGLVGGISGIGIGGAGKIVERSVSLDKGEMVTLDDIRMVEGSDLEVVEENLDQMVKDGLITEKKKEIAVTELRKLESDLNRVPEEYTPELKHAAIEKLREKDRLKAEIDGKDESLETVKKKKERIATIDEQLSHLETEFQRKANIIRPDNSSNYANMTETDNGAEFVFFHKSPEKLDVIDPTKYGRNKATSRQEASAIGRVGGVSMYYTNINDTESVVQGDYFHQVSIPKEKVYDFNNDHLNLAQKGKEQFQKDHPGQAYDANTQMAYVTKLAGELGYDMTVGEWNGTTRAQTTKPLNPQDIQVQEGNTIVQKFQKKHTPNREKGYKPIIPVPKQKQLEGVYQKAKKDLESKGKSGKVGQLVGSWDRYSQDAITQMIMDSDVDQSIKDEYMEVLERAVEPRRSEQVWSSIRQANEHKKHGGSTMHPKTGVSLVGTRDRTAVGLFPERSKTYKGKTVTDKQLDNFRKQNADILDGNEDYFSIGTWYDANTDQTYLDISAIVPTKVGEKLGKKYNQKAVFNLETMEEVETGGTGEMKGNFKDIPARVNEVVDLVEEATKGKFFTFAQEVLDNTEAMLKQAKDSKTLMDKLQKRSDRSAKKAERDVVKTEKRIAKVEPKAKKGDRKAKKELAMLKKRLETVTKRAERENAALTEGIAKSKEKTLSETKKREKLQAKFIEYVKGVMDSKFMDPMNKSKLTSILTGMKNTKTPISLENGIERVNGIVYDMMARTLEKQISKEIKKSVSRKSSGREVGSTVAPENARVLKAIRNGIKGLQDRMAMVETKDMKHEVAHNVIEELEGNLHDLANKYINEADPAALEAMMGERLAMSTVRLYAYAHSGISNPDKVANLELVLNKMKSERDLGRDRMKELMEERKKRFEEIDMKAIEEVTPPEKKKKVFSKADKNANPDLPLAGETEIRARNRGIIHIIKNKLFDLLLGSNVGDLRMILRFLSKKGDTDFEGGYFMDFTNRLIRAQTMKDYNSAQAKKKINDIAKRIYGPMPELDLASGERKGVRGLFKMKEFTKLGRTQSGEVTRVPVTYSKDILIKLWMDYQNPDNHRHYEASGFDAQTMAEIESLLDSRDMLFAQELFKFYKQHWEGVNEVYEKVYMFPLGKQKHYAGRLPVKGDFMEDINLLDSGYVSRSSAGGSTKARTGRAKVLEPVGALSSFVQYVDEMEHFKAYGEIHQEYNRLLNNQEMIDQIYRNDPDTANSMIKTLNYYKTEVLERGGKQREGLRVLNRIAGNIVRGTLALKPKIGAIQMLSITNGLTQLPPDMKYWMDGFDMENLSEVVQSEFLSNRLQKGATIELMTGLREVTSKYGPLPSASETSLKVVWNMYEQFISLGMSFVKYGDLVGVSGAMPAYGAWKAKYIAEGMSVEEAKAAALRKFEAAVDSSQQTQTQFGRSEMQNNPVGRFFTMYLSAPIQNYRNTVLAFNEIKRGLTKGKGAMKGTYTGNALRLLNYGVAQPMAYTYLSNLAIGTLKGLWDDEHEPSEADKTLMSALILRNSASIPIAGSIAQLIVDMFVFDKEHSFGSILSNPLFDEAEKVKKMADEWAMEEDPALKEDKKMRFWKGFSKMMLGLPVTQVKQVKETFAQPDQDVWQAVLDDSDIAERLGYYMLFSEYVVEQRKNDRLTKEEEKIKEEEEERKAESKKEEKKAKDKYRKLLRSQ